MAARNESGANDVHSSWLGPRGKSLVACEIDLKLGGAFRFVWRGLDHAIEVASKYPAAHLGEHESMPFDAERMA